MTTFTLASSLTHSNEKNYSIFDHHPRKFVPSKRGHSSLYKLLVTSLKDPHTIIPIYLDSHKGDITSCSPFGDLGRMLPRIPLPLSELTSTGDACWSQQHWLELTALCTAWTRFGDQCESRFKFPLWWCQSWSPGQFPTEWTHIVTGSSLFKPWWWLHHWSWGSRGFDTFVACWRRRRIEKSWRRRKEEL